MLPQYLDISAGELSPVMEVLVDDRHQQTRRLKRFDECGPERGKEFENFETDKTLDENGDPPKGKHSMISVKTCKRGKEKIWVSSVRVANSRGGYRQDQEATVAPYSLRRKEKQPPPHE